MDECRAARDLQLDVSIGPTPRTCVMFVYLCNYKRKIPHCLLFYIHKYTLCMRRRARRAFERAQLHHPKKKLSMSSNQNRTQCCDDFTHTHGRASLSLVYFDLDVGSFREGGVGRGSCKGILHPIK